MTSVLEDRLLLRLEAPFFAAANFTAMLFFSRLRKALDEAAHEHIKAALEYTASGDHERALIEYERALVRSPDDSSILMDAGQLAQEMHRYPQAIRWFRRALELQYQNSRALKGLAFALHATGEIDEAIYRYYRYLDANRDDYDALLNLSALFLDSARYEEAIEYSVRASSVKPGAAAPYYNIALANFNLGKFDRAEGNIRRAIEIEPTADSFRLFGDILETLGQFEKAIEQYQRAIDLNPAFAEAWIDVARMHEKLQRPAEYLKAALEAVALSERDAAQPKDLSLAYWDLGWAYYQNGDLTKSAEASRKAVDLTPEAAPPRFNLGLALLLLGEVDEARQQYQMAVKRSRRSNIKGDGIDDLQAVLRKRPDLEGGQEILNMLLAEYKNAEKHRPPRGLSPHA